MRAQAWLWGLLPLVLVGCASTGGGVKPAHRAHPATTAPVATTPAHRPKVSPYAPAQEDLSKRGDYVAGGLFRPGVPDTVPEEIPDVDAIPEPEVRDEPRARTGNRDYTVLGKKYRVLDDHEGYVEEGLASYYGNKFHGRRTSSQEVYDMYAFTGAHKTLPLPSFARVTNLDNGKTVIVRINDRGPFHPGRVIDLSYAAAVKLGYRNKGTARVRVEALQAEDDDGPRNAGMAKPDKPRAASSGMDKRVAALLAPEKAPSATTASQRFDMRQDGRTMSADEFDAWMQQRRIRIATGKPALAAPVMATAAPVALPAAVPVEASVPSVAGEQVTLQVASFSNMQNARHALSLLQGAAIAQAQLLDADIDGKKIWRLRIGPVNANTTPELAARIVGLGFGQPQRIRH